MNKNLFKNKYSKLLLSIIINPEIAIMLTIKSLKKLPVSSATGNIIKIIPVKLCSEIIPRYFL